MSTLNPPKRISKKHELREDAVITSYARAWAYFDQHRKLVYGVIAGLVVLVAAIIGYVIYQNQQAEEAEEHLARIVAVYEQGSYQEALDGTADNLGLLEIAEEYGSSSSGNLAHFYAADALYHLGEYERALEHFDEFDKPDGFLGASAIAGEAAVYENRGEHERAADRYLEAARFFENPLSSPQYLLNAGRAYEAAGDYAAATRAYEEVKEDYPDSQIAAQIDIYIARAEAKQNS